MIFKCIYREVFQSTSLARGALVSASSFIYVDNSQISMALHLIPNNVFLFIYLNGILTQYSPNISQIRGIWGESHDHPQAASHGSHHELDLSSQPPHWWETPGSLRCDNLLTDSAKEACPCVTKNAVLLSSLDRTSALFLKTANTHTETAVTKYLTYNSQYMYSRPRKQL